MPTQHRRTSLGGFVDKKLHARIARLASQAGMKEDTGGFAAKLIQEAVQRRTLSETPQPAKRRTLRSPGA